MMLAEVRGNNINHVQYHDNYISTYLRLFAVIVPAVITTTQAETTAGLCVV